LDYYLFLPGASDDAWSSEQGQNLPGPSIVLHHFPRDMELLFQERRLAAVFADLAPKMMCIELKKSEEEVFNVNKRAVLRKAIMERRALVVPGCYDALSAKIIESCGFEAIQISGFGVAGSSLGKADVGLLQIKEILDVSWNVAQAVQIPVMADLDTGGGNAINASWVTERVIRMGLAGMNIEDQVFPKRCGHLAGKEIISAEEMAGKVRACAKIRNQLDPEFIINARTDAYAVEGLEEAIRRCNLYLEAGADLVFIDGIGTLAEIEKAVQTIHGPLSINLMDGVTGVRTQLISVPDLARLGVARVSIPVASILVVHRALMNFFKALKSSPDGLLAGETHWLSSFQDFTHFVGLEEYQEFEKEFLPKGKFRS
jgi:2-methylisocitrate lyase-like PEP mutase family enzyme